MSDSPPPCFLSHFASLRDPRQATKVLYPLPEILLLLLCATIAGADDFMEIGLWGSEHPDFRERFLPYEQGIPSHDTLCDVIAAIDPELFKSCFLAWADSLCDNLPEAIAIDGKTSRRSHNRRKGRLPLHTVSAWACLQRLVLGQQAVSEKSNEITAIPLLLKRLELKGALVTIDAMGTQREIAQTIVDGSGDYVLALKENWPATYAEGETVFAGPPANLVLRSVTTVDGDHGRIETRKHTICHDVDWMCSDRRFPGEVRFPGLKAIGMIESKTERNGVVEQEKRYYLCSTPLDIDMFARRVRGPHFEWIMPPGERDDKAGQSWGNRPLIPGALDIDRCPVPRADGADAVWVVDQEVPGVEAGSLDGFVAIPHTIAQLVGAQVGPYVLHRVQLRGIRRQFDHDDVVWDFKFVCGLDAIRGGRRSAQRRRQG